MTTMEDITLLRVNYLRGPNVWTYRPVLEVWLDLGRLEDHPSNTLPGLNERLVAQLPALIEHHCGVGERGGFLERLKTGTWAGHVLEHVVIELLNLAGMPTAFGQTRSTRRPGVYRMVFRARDEQVARAALLEGHALLMAAINDQPFDLAPAVARLRDKVESCYLGPSTACIVAAATDRRIPHIRLNEGNLVQLGYGAAQRRIWTAETDLTSAIAEGIAGDKELTKGLLKACGVPVPEGQSVDSAQAAWEAAQDIGLPVVIKPTDGNHGRGVALDLNTQADIEAAYALAAEQGSGVLVERLVHGDEHRLLVVGGKVVAAARGETLSIKGDGRSTVAQLVDAQINTDPRRGLSEEFPLSRIDLSQDEVIALDLRRQGLGPDDVPERGREVLIQRNGNVAIDCTDQVHPEVEHVVALAARIVGLDIAGVDVVARDIGRPLHEQGGAIVEVNAGPGLLMHLKPAEGAPRPVGRSIVDHLFAREDAPAGVGRIPIVGVAGTQGTQTLARLVAWLVHLSGRHVGLACRDGLFLDRRRIDTQDAAHWEGGHRLLINGAIEAAVIEASPRAILRDGLPYDRCQVGVVTDVQGLEALADFDVHEPEDLLKVLRTQVDVVLPHGAAVLNAHDERVAALASLCDGRVILYGQEPSLPALEHHRAQGGQSVFMRDGGIVLAKGSHENTLAELSSLALRQGRGTPVSSQTLLAAIACAWALDIAPDLITAGIETFDPDLSPARPAASFAYAR